MKGYIFVIFFMLFCYMTFSQSTEQSDNNLTYNFRASVVKIDITPDSSQCLIRYGGRESTGVNDHIYHRIVALDDGNNQFILVSTDICLNSPVDYDRLATQIEKELGISPTNFWWTATHTHSAPDVGTHSLMKIMKGNWYPDHKVDMEYSAQVERKLIEGIRKAQQKLSPAQLGVNWGYSQANINRRAKDIDGEAFLGMDPDGPVDQRIGLLRIDFEDGTPMVLIANYPIHGTFLGRENQKISGDVPGIVSEYVEQKTGIPLLFINGAAGDLAPIYSGYSNPKSKEMSQFRVLLGDKILDASRKISSLTAEVKLSTGSLIVETPRKPDMDWPSDFGEYTRTTNTGINMVRLPIRFLKINEDIAIWSAPVELFCEISNEIRDSSPFPYTFYYGYTNGWLGYLLTESEYKHGGYEPTASPFTPRAASDLTDAVVSYLQGNFRR